MSRTPQPITIRGTTYPSHRAAAQANGVTVHAVSKAKARGRLDVLGLPYGCPVEIDGASYHSMTEAARCTGLDLNAIRALAHPQRGRGK